MSMTVIGNYLSPYVRKVLVCLDIKSIDYKIDPIIPFYGNDEFTRLNPDRRIPVLVHDNLVLTESAVICEYLEEAYPKPALLPSTPHDRGRARSLQAFADGRMGDVFIWRLFNQLVIKPFVWSQPADPEELASIQQNDIPQILDYLENIIPDRGFLFGPLGLADIAVACMVRNAHLVSYTVDSARWPLCSAFVHRSLEQSPFQKLRPYEEIMMRTPVARQREALRAAGAPISAETLGSSTPVRGPLTT